MGGRFQAKGDFRAIDPEHARISARRGFSDPDGVAWEEAQFHQSSGDIVGDVQAVENAHFARFEL